MILVRPPQRQQCSDNQHPVAAAPHALLAHHSSSDVSRHQLAALASARLRPRTPRGLAFGACGLPRLRTRSVRPRSTDRVKPAPLISAGCAVASTPMRLVGHTRKADAVRNEEPRSLTPLREAGCQCWFLAAQDVGRCDSRSERQVLLQRDASGTAAHAPADQATGPHHWRLAIFRTIKRLRRQQQKPSSTKHALPARCPTAVPAARLNPVLSCAHPAKSVWCQALHSHGRTATYASEAPALQLCGRVTGLSNAANVVGSSTLARPRPLSPRRRLVRRWGSDPSRATSSKAASVGTGGSETRCNGSARVRLRTQVLVTSSLRLAAKRCQLGGRTPRTAA
jgi:hypothetical protein